MKGMLNHGNECYWNAALLTMLYCPQLTNYLMSDLVESDVLRKRLNANALLAEYRGLVHKYWRAEGTGPLDSTRLKTAFTKLNKGFAGKHQQHDAHEALLLLLRNLHDALAKSGKPEEPYLCQQADIKAWESHNLNDFSMLTPIFQGQARVTLSNGRGYESVSYEHFWDLALPLQGSASLAHALAAYAAPQPLSNHPQGADVVQRRLFTHLPLILITTLKRFKPDGTKITKYIDYEAEISLDHTISIDTARFSLFAVVLHTGNAAEGHYTTICEIKGHWYYVNDAEAKKLTKINMLVSKDAYILVWKKQLC